MALNAFLPFNTAWTRADSAGQGKDVTGILTDLNATVTQNGKGIGENGTLTTDDISVKVSFGVPVEGDNLPEGVAVVEKNDTATFELSKGFTLNSNPGESVELRTKTDGGILVGHVSFSTNSETKMVTATVTFDGENQVFNGDCNLVSCEFNASLAYDKSGDAGSTGDHDVQILNKDFKVNVPAPEIQYGMEKLGTEDLANKCIHWTATVTATQDGRNIDLGGYTFSDDLTSVVEYSEGTFKAGGSSVEPTVDENNKLTYTFPTGTTSPQTVTFDTAIPDAMCYAEGQKKTVSNTARLLDSENSIKAQGTAVVTFTPTWIEKKGEPHYSGSSGLYDPKNRTITWTITANQYGAALQNAYITDLLPDGLTLVSATAQTWNGSDWVDMEPKRGWTTAPADGKYELGDINTPILLTIVTSVPDAAYATMETTYSNYAKIFWEGGPGNGLDTGDVDVGVGYNAITKNGTLDPETGIITWTVTVNTRTETIPNLKVYDLLVYGDSNSGFDSTDVNGIEGLTPRYNQKYIDKSFSVTNPPDGANLKLTKTTLQNDSTDAADLLEITGFANSASNNVTFTFQTQVVNPGIFAGNGTATVSNTATLFSANEKLNSATDNVSYPSHMLAKEMLKRGSDPTTAAGANSKTANAGEGFDYVDKSVIFRLSVNADGLNLSGMKKADGMPLGAATVTDTLPDGWEFTEIAPGKQYLIFAGSTGSDKSVTATGDPVTGVNLTANFNGTSEDGRNTATFEFPTLDQPYVILVKAKPTDGTAAGYFSKNGTTPVKNSLNLRTGNWTPGISVDQNVSITSQILNKNAVRPTAGVLTWSVDYKPYDLREGGTKIEDTLPDGIDLRTDSSGNLLFKSSDGEEAYITVNKMSLNADGSYEVGESVPLSTDIISYDNASRVLTFNIPDNSAAYRFSYLTDITGDPGEVTNQVKLIGGSGGDTDANHSYTISQADGSATLQRGGSITVDKIDGDGASLPGAQFTLFAANGTSVFRVGTTGSGGALKFRAIPVGDYTLRETEAPDGYTPNGRSYAVSVRQASDGKIVTTVDGAGTSVVPVKNYLDGTTGDLIISKVVAGNAADAKKAFDFTVTLHNADGEPISGSFDYIGTGVPSGAIAFDTQGVGSVSLAHGQSVRIIGLPKNASYTVTEGDYSGEGYSTVSTGAVGTVAADATQTAAFTNTKNTPSNPSYPVVTPTGGSLTISKTAVGDGADTAKKFDFTVTFTGAPDSYPYTGNGVPGGTIRSGDTVSLAHGQSITVTGLPEGAEYRVSEGKASAEGYAAESTGSSGTISSTQNEVAAFTNTKLPSSTGSLTIRKTVTGKGADPARKFDFTVTFSGAPGSYPYTGNGVPNGRIRSGGTVSLAHGQSVTITGLPEGAGYAVKEKDYTKAGYAASSTGTSGVISADAAQTASFTNAWSSVPGNSGTDIGDMDVPHASMDGSNGNKANGGMPETGDDRTGDLAKTGLFFFSAAFAALFTVDFLLHRKRSGNGNRK